MSEIYKIILERKLNNFINVFSNDSNSIFKGSSNKLIHPGEYGKYREESCKDILKLLLKSDCLVSDGFICTYNDKISTQCDIIVYNSTLSPLITNDIAKMFPIEEVRAIGEVKSNLSKSEFKEALIKLSKNKKLYKERKGKVKKKDKYGVFHGVSSFLICNKLDFTLTISDWEEIYDGIPEDEWHNAILSIEDGFISYSLDCSKLHDNTVKILKYMGYDGGKKISWQYPTLQMLGEYINLDHAFLSVNKDDTYGHIVMFFAAIVRLINKVDIYEHDPIEYLGLDN